MTLVDENAHAGRSLTATRALVDKHLQEAPLVAHHPSAPGQAPDPATWGLLPEHQAGMRAAMGMRG